MSSSSTASNPLAAHMPIRASSIGRRGGPGRGASGEGRRSENAGTEHEQTGRGHGGSQRRTRRPRPVLGHGPAPGHGDQPRKDGGSRGPCASISSSHIATVCAVVSVAAVFGSRSAAW